MAARAGVHLSADVLQAFGLGKLDDAAAETVANHLAELSRTCRQKATEMSSDDITQPVPRCRPAPESARPCPRQVLSWQCRRVRTGNKSLSSTPMPAANLPPELA